MVQLLTKLFLILVFTFPFLHAYALPTGNLNYLTSFMDQNSMDHYCSVPPFAATKVKPNVVFLMDFSGSMQFPAYYPCDEQFPLYNKKKIAKCGKVDTEYDPGKTYYGYFKSDKYYTYDRALKAWRETDTCNVPDGWERIGYGECFSGNFLNFLIMTRIDTALKALIGGKADCSGVDCILMSQGARRRVTVSFKGKNGKCMFFLHPQGNKRYSTMHMLIKLKNDECKDCGDCPFTRWKGNRRADVVVNISERHGVIQDNFDKVDMSFLVFASDDRYGEVRYSFYENDLQKLVDAVQSEMPYAGTPTGEAMWEVEDFLRQENKYPYEDNSQYIARGTEKDPYYMSIDGNLFPVPCKKSYVVLISDGEWNGKEDPVEPAYDMHVNDLRDDIEGKQTAEVFTLYAFGTSAEGRNSMETVAAFGSFEDSCSDNWPYPFTDYPSDSRTQSWPVSECTPGSSYNSCCTEWDSNRDGVPDTFYAASNGKELEEALRKVFEKILSPTSGTSVASLSQRDVKGAVLCQSVFYPYRSFSGNKLSWVGYMYTWWFLNTKDVQNIREDTNENKVLDILDDYIVDWAYDNGELVINKYQSDSKGEISSKIGTYTTFNELNPVFEVGEKLAYTASKERRIYTDVNGSLVSFDTSHLNEFSQYLGNDLPDCLGGDKGALVNYIRGEDIPGCRVRTIDASGDTWKLGDITYSSPVIEEYPDYNVIFVGSNDGMLHAFKLGYLKKKSDSQHPVELSNSASDTGKDLIGEELWAFIPKNALPYLRYLADKDYCHIYYVDLTPYVIHVNLNGEIRKILIGGMRLGGATGSSDSAAITPPSDTCNGSYCVGLSSYFALDVTNPEKPSFMWEFTAPDLGFSYSGPGIIKEGDKYYVVFASGPVNYRANFSDSSTTLKIFVVDLSSGKLVSEIDTGLTNAFAGRIFKEGVDINGDGNTDYLFFGFSRQDGSADNFKGGLIVLSKKGSSSDRLLPLNDNPADWIAVSIQSLGRDIMPVTSKVELMKCFNRWYVYFGTGRWFYKLDSTEVTRNGLFGVPILTDTNSYNSFTYIYFPSRIVDVSDENGEGSKTICTEASRGIIDGWYLELDNSDWSQGYLKEKAISDPTLTKDNVVLFTTIQPNGRPCELGGHSRLWALNCATGGAIQDTCSTYSINKLYGTVLLQLSGTDIHEIKIRYDRTTGQSNISTVFPEKNNRATVWFTGIAPESAPPFVYPSSSLIGTLLLWLEM